MTIPYTKNTTWADNAGGGTPITAAKLNNVETGIFEAQQQPAVHVTHNANQSIAASTETTLAFNTERFDQVGGVASTMHDNVTNNSRLTCLYAGIYYIAANISWGGATPSTVRALFLRLNGTTRIASVVAPPDAAVGASDLAVSVIYQLAVNDFVEVRVQQNSAGALNVQSTGNYSPEFMMVRVA